MKLQEHIFELIRNQLGPHISLVDTLAEVLHVSKDSAYRRIRGEKNLDLQELETLADHFSLSIDHYLNHGANVVNLKYEIVGSPNYSFGDFLNNNLERLKAISQVEGSFISYSARDLPSFHYYRFPELAAFKMFYWHRTQLHDPYFQGLDFDLDHLPSELQSHLSTANQMWQYYSCIDSEELWSPETTNTILRQILYYYEARIFKNASQAILLMDQYQELLSLIQKEAEQARRSRDQDHESTLGANFDLYFNEESVMPNTIIVKVKEETMVFIGIDISTLMNTQDKSFCKVIEGHHSRYKKKSTLLSGASEKVRNKLFTSFAEAMNLYKEMIQ
jgi:hypothetical protein